MHVENDVACFMIVCCDVWSCGVRFSAVSDTSMAISNLAQFWLLLWKNWLLQKRRVVVTIFQIIIPVLFAVVLLGVRALVDSKFVEEPTTWESFKASTFPSHLTSFLNPRSERFRTRTNMNETNMTSSEPTMWDNFEVSDSLTSNLTRTETSLTSPDNQTLLLNMTSPPDKKWFLVFSPNTSKAAERIANNTAQMLDMMPLTSTSIRHYGLLSLLYLTLYRSWHCTLAFWPYNTMRIRDQSIREVVNLIMGVRKMRNYVMRLCAFILRPWIRHWPM